MSDHVVRALTKDGAFRAIAARTTETVKGAVRAQGATGENAKHLGDLLTGAVLIREAMAPSLRVQAIIKGASGGNLVADAQPDGTSRGLVQLGKAEGSRVRVGKGALLQVMRTLPSGAMHQGVVEVAGDAISDTLMAYMQDSEQVVSMIAVATLFAQSGEIEVAGGYLLQLLPEVERGPLAVMTERLRDFERLDEVLRGESGSPDKLLDELFYGMPFARTGSSPLSFGCACSQTRVLTSLATLPRADIEELIRDGEALEIRCDFCGKEYGVYPAELTALLTPS